MEQRPAFKKQLLGLEQDAVFQYIEQMSRTASESEQKLREQIDQVTRSREELEGQIASFEEKLRSVNETLDTEKGKNKKLSEMIGLLQEEIDRQRRQSEAHSREYQAMQESSANSWVQTVSSASSMTRQLLPSVLLFWRLSRLPRRLSNRQTFRHSRSLSRQTPGHRSSNRIPDDSLTV